MKLHLATIHIRPEAGTTHISVNFNNEQRDQRNRFQEIAHNALHVNRIIANIELNLERNYQKIIISIDDERPDDELIPIGAEQNLAPLPRIINDLAPQLEAPIPLPNDLAPPPLVRVQNLARNHFSF